MLERSYDDFCVNAGSRDYFDFCEQCPIYPSKRPVHGFGNNGASIMFIGQEPGEVEDSQGVPFCGPSGKRFSVLLEELGLRRADVYITNLVSCMRVQGNKHNRKTVNYCAGNWLMNEIIECDPEFVICLGKDAYSWLQKQTGLFFPIDCKIIQFRHPASALRNPIDEARLRVQTDNFKEEYLDGAK